MLAWRPPSFPSLRCQPSIFGGWKRGLLFWERAQHGKPAGGPVTRANYLSAPDKLVPPPPPPIALSRFVTVNVKDRQEKRIRSKQ